MRLDESTHDELRAQLAALAKGSGVDDVLTHAQRAALMAHLTGCPTCARELQLQEQVRARLVGFAPAEPAPHGLAAMVRGLARGGAPRARPSRAWLAAAASGWAAAACLALAWWAQPAAVRIHPPMVEAALRDFTRALEGELPAPQAFAELAATVGHPVSPLEHPGLQLISTWRTEIRGEPAAALAYRLRDRIIVQYVLSESLLYRQPIVRDAVQAHGTFAASDGARSVVAFAGGGAGSVLVGVISPGELTRLTGSLLGGAGKGI